MNCNRLTICKEHIRWLIRRDIDEVLKIESACFDFPWSEKDFIRSLRQRNCIGMVVDHDKGLLGYMIYELHKTRFHLLSLAVHPDWRRRGVGQAMVEKLIGTLSHQRRSRITLEVRETNLGAQIFFRDMGFRCVSVMKDFYEDTDEDAYFMTLRVSRRDAKEVQA